MLVWSLIRLWRLLILFWVLVVVVVKGNPVSMSAADLKIYGVNKNENEVSASRARSSGRGKQLDVEFLPSIETAIPSAGAPPGRHKSRTGVKESEDAAEVVTVTTYVTHTFASSYTTSTVWASPASGCQSHRGYNFDEASESTGPGRTTCSQARETALEGASPNISDQLSSTLKDGMPRPTGAARMSSETRRRSQAPEEASHVEHTTTASPLPINALSVLVAAIQPTPSSGAPQQDPSNETSSSAEAPPTPTTNPTSTSQTPASTTNSLVNEHATILSFGTEVITASRVSGTAGEVAIGSVTLSVGGPARTVRGEVVSKGSNGVVIGQSRTVNVGGRITSRTLSSSISTADLFTSRTYYTEKPHSTATSGGIRPQLGFRWSSATALFVGAIMCI